MIDMTKQIQELQKRFEQIQSKLEKSTDDFKQQTKDTLEVCKSMHCIIIIVITITVC